MVLEFTTAMIVQHALTAHLIRLLLTITKCVLTQIVDLIRLFHFKVSAVIVHQDKIQIQPEETVWVRDQCVQETLSTLKMVCHANHVELGTKLIHPTQLAHVSKQFVQETPSILQID